MGHADCGLSWQVCAEPQEGEGRRRSSRLGGVSKRGGQAPVTLRLAEVMIGNRNGHIVIKRKCYAHVKKASGTL